jgi:hypothetical protein
MPSAWLLPWLVGTKGTAIQIILTCMRDVPLYRADGNVFNEAMLRQIAIMRSNLKFTPLNG